MAKAKTNWLAILVGLMLFIFGGALDLTVVGLPPGVTADIIGVVLMVWGTGWRP